MITENFDEMTGVGQFNTQEFWLAKTMGVLSTRKMIKMRICVVLDEDGKTPFFVFNREGEDWLWLHDATFHGLLDGKRFSADGQLISSDTKVLGNTLVCMETVGVEFDKEMFEAFSTFNSFKIRVGNLDFDLDYEFREAAGEMMAAIAE